MATYARKPHVVEAYQWRSDSQEEYPEWLFDALIEGGRISLQGKTLYLNNGRCNGAYIVSDGDYIVLEGDGSLIARHPAVFEQEYALLR